MDAEEKEYSRRYAGEQSWEQQQEHRYQERVRQEQQNAQVCGARVTCT